MTNERGRGPAERAGGVERTVAVAAVMALTIVAGVGVVLLFPRARPASPVELARPAPVAHATTPAWLAPQAPPIASPPQAVSPVPAPPLRARRLAESQVARPHAVSPPVVAARTAAAGPARSSACRAPASVADRMVCGRPALASLDQAMRRAYDHALASGADRLDIDRGQARWRDERDRATDADQLSRLYARRIAELDDAARRSARRRIYG